MGRLGKKILHPINSIKESRVKKAFEKVKSEDIAKIPSGMKTLRNTGHYLTLLAYVNLLKHSYPEIRTEAIEQIGFKKHYLNGNEKFRSEIYKRLSAMLSTKNNEFVRQAAVTAMGELDDAEFAVPRIQKLLSHDRDNEVILAAIDVLGKYKNHPHAKEILGKLLSHPDFVQYSKEITNALQRNSVI